MKTCRQINLPTIIALDMKKKYLNKDYELPIKKIIVEIKVVFVWMKNIFKR